LLLREWNWTHRLRNYSTNVIKIHQRNKIGYNVVKLLIYVDHVATGVLIWFVAKLVYFIFWIFLLKSRNHHCNVVSTMRILVISTILYVMIERSTSGDNWTHVFIETRRLQIYGLLPNHLAWRSYSYTSRFAYIWLNTTSSSASSKF